MPLLDTGRNGDVFSTHDFRDSGKTVLVVGAGMLGSHIAEQLAKLGLNLKLCDFDHVEAHNVSNQAVGLEEIGMLKVDALKKRLERDCGIQVETFPHAFDESVLPASVVFVAPDSNDTRRQIWDLTKQKFGVELYIEVRTGPIEGRIYCLDPWNSVQTAAYESPKILYPDAQAVDRGNGACHMKTSLAFTGSAIASMAVAQFVRWVGIQKGVDDVMNNEIILTLWPPHTYTRRFV